MKVKLLEKSWLYRTLIVEESNENLGDVATVHYIKYDGRGIGNEKIYVDRVLVKSSTSLLWFTPRFQFSIGEHKAILEIRVLPWLSVQYLRLFLNNSLEYAEGGNPMGSDTVYIFMSFFAFLGIITVLFIILTVLFNLALFSGHS